MFLRNAWYVGAEAREVGRKLLARRVIGDGLVFYRTESGQAVALQDRCAHRFAPLSKGRLEGDTVRCGYHGLRFDGSGCCVEVPGVDEIPAIARVHSYPVKEIGPWIWVWMGEPDKADESLIPECRWLDMPEWAVVHGITPLRANYQYLTDNLMDLSHESYLHDTTIGNIEIPQFPLKTWHDDDTVVTSRDMVDVSAPPFLKHMGGYSGNIDRWHTVHFAPPAYVWIESGAAAAGSNRADALDRRGLHAITPETEDSTNYFWALCRNFAIDDPETSSYFEGIVRDTFDQDTGMIEAQAANIGRDGPVPPLAKFDIDEAAILSRRLLARKIKAEQQAVASHH